MSISFSDAEQLYNLFFIPMVTKEKGSSTSSGQCLRAITVNLVPTGKGTLSHWCLLQGTSVITDVATGAFQH